ncbi:MAG TPA: dTDP-4-dehydrorhamnose reductase [Gemmatimonadaceae bacterium]|nr:dTDP-4-dehydrorhamnose reductase [Gemmatimonadaceae bacterium]
MSVVVIGANGQLGADLMAACAVRGRRAVGLTHTDIELTNAGSVWSALDHTAPDLIVNTAAMHNVDACERDPSHAFAVNAVGARHLAQAAEHRGATLVHVSTDYVFDGRKGQPYVETDAARPLNAYGVSKLAGEHFVTTLAPKHFVVRTSGLYGANPSRAKAGGLNFVRLMLKLAKEKGRVRVVTDEVVTPTYTADLAEQILDLAETTAYGTYHATSGGACSWNEFAREIFRCAAPDTVVEDASAADFPRPVARPLYSVLDNAGLRRLGIDRMADWRDALSRYLAAL